jgi:succinoglycan biosynthesis protein ExoA
MPDVEPGREVGDIEVSVLVPVLDEERHIRDAVARMQEQDIDGPVEFIFLDGGSSDRTREILEELASADPRVRILSNPERRTPNALNLGLAHSRGRLVARMDAHTRYPTNYLSAGAERLARGDVDWVSGPQIASGDDTWSRRVALALSSTLGSGGAKFRHRIEQEIEVDSGFTGVWDRRSLERFGGWDVGWPVNQDHELAARMRADGCKIVCIPEMAAEYIPRNSLKKLARQYWTYGIYRAKTSGAHPESMRRSHVLAPGLALCVLLAVASPRPLRSAARLGVGVYALALVWGSLDAGRDGERDDALGLLAVYPCMHLAAGFGFLYGSLKFGPPLAAVARVLRP